MSTLRHGHALRGSVTRTYRIWKGMRRRCEDPTDNQYANYGGRGIKVCERWNLSFDAFLADMGEAPPDKSLERSNNDLGYAPGNCKWATRVEQRRNTRVNHLLTFEGRTQCIAAWAEELSLNHHTLRTRISRGWSADEALRRLVR